MSYDVSLVVRAATPKDDEYGYPWDGFQDVWSRNYTSNCGPMWRAAGIDFHDWEDRPATAMLPVLLAAIHTLEADSGRFEAMNPENGWGSYDTVVPWLRELAVACARYDLTIVRISS